MERQLRGESIEVKEVLVSKYFGMVVVFVQEYARCLEFYKNALELDVVMFHEGEGHPPWALLQREGFRMALHAEREGSPHKCTGVLVNFFVDDIPRAVERIAYGGSILREPIEADFRPTQPVMAYIGRFCDPDGNEHYLIKETKNML